MYGPVLEEMQGVETELGGVFQGSDFNSILMGGKRLRPALVLLSSLFGRGPCPSVRKLAAAVEILHLATLVHDDIIDGSDCRRGERTVNNLMGQNTAILAGDYLYAIFLERTAGLPEFALSTLSTSLKTMVNAEIDQQRALFKSATSEKEYLTRVTGKSGAFLSCCCKLGASLSGVSHVSTLSLERFGLFLGVSFQITDDLLDFTGDALNLGKPVAQDIRHGVLTLPVIHALKYSPRKTEICVLIEKKELPTTAVEFIVSELCKAGSFSYTHRLARRCAWMAGRALASLPENDARQSLFSLLDFITTRRY